MLAGPPSAMAGTAWVGQLPEPARATFAVTSQGPAEDMGPLRECLGGLGMRWAEAPAYLVQFSRVVRPPKMLVEQGAQDRASRPRRGRQTGKAIEIASLALVDTATGATVFQAKVSRKIRRNRPAAASIVSEMCALLRSAPAHPD